MGKKSRIKFRQNKETSLAKILNDLTYDDYYNRLKKLATSIFEWENIPSSCNEDYLENSLFENGIATFLDTEQIIINTNSCSGGYINMYNLPSKLDCFTADGQHYTRDLFISEEQDRRKTCILVKNTKEMTPTSQTMQLFAYRLFVAERTLDINAHNLRMPYIIACDEKMRVTVEQLLSKIENFEPKVIGRKNLIENIGIEVLNTNTPVLLNDFETYKDKIWNEALTFLGINNISIEKKERLITNESEQNNELINLNLQSFLVPRQKACDDFNKLFKPDKPLKVKVRSDLENIIKSTLSNISYNRNEVVNNE